MLERIIVKFLHKVERISTSEYLPLAWIYVGGLLLFVAAAVTYYYHALADTRQEGHPVPVMLLMALPVLQVFAALKIEDKFLSALYSMLTLFSFFLCNIFWLLYSWSVGFGDSEFRFFDLVSYFAFSMGAFLTLVVLAVTWIMMRDRAASDRADRILRNSKDLIRNHSFHTVCFFLSVFVCTAYIFGFSLAFSDKASWQSFDYPALLSSSSFEFPGDSGGKARSSKGPYSGEASKVRGTGPDNRSPQAGYEGNGEPDSEESDVSDSLNKLILFKSGGTEVEYGKEEVRISDEDSDPEYAAKVLFNHNSKAIKAVANFINSSFGRNSAGGNGGWSRRIRIILVGHANNEPIGSVNSSFSSNFEISLARAYSVQYAILESGFVEELYWPRVEWVYTPRSLEGELRGSHDDDLPRDIKKKRLLDQKISVEILVRVFGDSFVAPDYTQSELANVRDELKGYHDLTHFYLEEMRTRPRKLGLIDYIYFSIYTITTTGYGDIVPIKPFVKLVCSAANLAELFFLVIFFNVLFAAKNEDHSGNEDDAKQRLGLSTPQLEESTPSSVP